MTAALEGGEWSAARPGRTLPPGKTRYPFYRRLGGPQGRSGRADNLVPTRIQSRTVQPVVSRYTDWDIRNVYIYTHTHIYTYVCMYIYIYTHTHTHTYIYVMSHQNMRIHIRRSVNISHKLKKKKCTRGWCSVGRVVWELSLRPLACWNCGFKSHHWHACLSWVLFVVCWKSLCWQPIPRPDESYQVWCVWSRNLKNAAA